MQRTIGILVVLGLTATIGTAAAQEVDARAALQASLKAMGDVRTVEYAGAGFTSLIGQQYSVDVGWPTLEVANYTRAIDYAAQWSREDYTRRQGNYPTFGRMPLADQRVTAIVSGQYAWDVRDNMPVPLTRPYLDGVPSGATRNPRASRRNGQDELEGCKGAGGAEVHECEGAGCTVHGCTGSGAGCTVHLRTGALPHRRTLAPCPTLESQTAAQPRA